MSHQKGDVIESVQDAGQYVVIAINEGGDMSTFTHARQDCLAMMLMEFFDKHPDIYDTMWQMKVAAQLGQLAEKELGAEKADELFDMLSRLARGEASEGEASEGEGSSMDEMKKFMDGLFKDNNTPN